MGRMMVKGGDLHAEGIHNGSRYREENEYWRETCHILACVWYMDLERRHIHIDDGHVSAPCARVDRRCKKVLSTPWN